jgi:hypothetical protein
LLLLAIGSGREVEPIPSPAKNLVLLYFLFTDEVEVKRCHVKTTFCPLILQAEELQDEAP